MRASPRSAEQPIIHSHHLHPSILPTAVHYHFRTRYRPTRPARELTRCHHPQASEEMEQNLRKSGLIG